VEAVVWDHVKALLADPAVLHAQYEQGRGDPAVDERAEQERERIERKLTALDREVRRLIDAYQAEVIELSELSERRRGVEEQGRMLQERLRAIEQQRTSRENELRVLEGVEAFCASVRGSLAEPSFEVKQKVLQLVVDRVVVEDSRVVIQHIIPTGPVRLQTEQLGQKTPTSSSREQTGPRRRSDFSARNLAQCLRRSWPPSRYRQRLSAHRSEPWARSEGYRVADAMIETITKTEKIEKPYQP
jgi:hypothetical protein